MIQVADFKLQQNFIEMFKKMTHFFLKTTCVTYQRTMLKMNRFVNPKYTTHPPSIRYFKKQGTPADQHVVNNNESPKVEKTTEIENHEPRLFQEIQKNANLTLPKVL